MFTGWKQRVRQLKTEIYALYLAYQDPRTPWYAKVVAALVVAYALSPLDLIPDVVPVLGYVDDLVLLPLGIILALRLIPAAVMADCRARAAEARRLPISRLGLVIVVALWLLAVVVVVRLVAGEIS